MLIQVGQFALAGLAALLLVGFATYTASRRVGTREAIADARTTTVIKAQGLVEPLLDDDLVTGSAPARTALDRLVRTDVLSADLVRVKLWTPQGRIVYSDDPRVIGATYVLGADEKSSLQTGRIAAEVSDLSKPENRFDTGFHKLLEVYLPVQTTSGSPLLFEAYYRYDLVKRNGDRLWRSIAPITLGALVMLQLVQLPLAWSLATRLQARVREREQLLQRALEASEVERRQIASDLHDSVVQDLAGVAFSLAAAAREPARDAADSRALDAAAESVRGGVRDLRSLVVDLYPPDFSEVALPSALEDLVARTREDGTDAELQVFVAPGMILSVGVARLVYRAAQEGLRNVKKHAGATSVVVRVVAADGRAVLEVTDNGRGFTAEDRELRRKQGHVGLVALEGLVGDAGGTLTVTGGAGGTSLRLEVPEP